MINVCPSFCLSVVHTDVTDSRSSSFGISTSELWLTHFVEEIKGEERIVGGKESGREGEGREREGDW